MISNAVENSAEENSAEENSAVGIHAWAAATYLSMVPRHKHTKEAAPNSEVGHRWHRCRSGPKSGRSVEVMSMVRPRAQRGAISAIIRGTRTRLMFTTTGNGWVMAVAMSDIISTVRGSTVVFVARSVLDTCTICSGAARTVSGSTAPISAWRRLISRT